MMRFGEVFVLAKNDRFDIYLYHVFAKDRVGTVRHAEICL